MIDTDALRNKVLLLAMQGKLTEQLAEDGHAGKLYDEIQIDKQRLIRLGKIKKGKVLQQITEEEIPFSIPENWKWIRWGELSESIQYGYNAPAKTEGRIKMVRISDIQDGKVMWDTVPYCDIDEKDIEQYLLHKNDILFARTGGTVGKSYIVSEVPNRAVFAGYLIRTSYSSKLCAQYMKYFMESSLYWKQLENGTIATAQPNCNGNTLAKMIVPLPPYEEQVRIVEIINKMYTILDTIDEYQIAYSSNVEVLKNKFIDITIQGTLTEQLPEDGTAEELFAEIQAEKAKLIKEKKIKKEKTLEVITEDEIPFEIPNNWKWVRLGDICSKISSGNTPAGGSKGGAYVTEGYCFFREQNIYNDGIHNDGMVYITEELLNTRLNSTVLPKDILLNITGGSIGRCALIPDDFSRGSINQHILIIRVVDPRIRFYIHKCLCSPYYQKLIMGNVVGDKDGFSAGRCKNTLIPLPPIAEQMRIVDKIDELLSLI